MKQLKIFVLAVAATLGLLVIVGAGASQATVLCTTEETACSMSYPKGTTVDLSLKSGTSMVLKSTGGSIEDTCSGGTVKGTSEAEAGSAVAVELSEWSWSSCSNSTSTVAAGSLELEHILGTHDGTVRGKGTEWKFILAGVECLYGFGTGTDLGTLTGGAEPVLKINTAINKTGGKFLCPTTVRLEAEYVVTEPHALYVI